jgi:hypothetical protein
MPPGDDDSFCAYMDEENVFQETSDQHSTPISAAELPHIKGYCRLTP